MLINLYRIKEDVEGIPPPDCPSSIRFSWAEFSQKLEGQRACMMNSSTAPSKEEQ